MVWYGMVWYGIITTRFKICSFSLTVQCQTRPTLQSWIILIPYLGLASSSVFFLGWIFLVLLLRAFFRFFFYSFDLLISFSCFFFRPGLVFLCSFSFLMIRIYRGFMF